MTVSFEEALQDYYRVLKPLGKGSFGTVVKARDNLTGCYVAIKFYNHEFLEHEQRSCNNTFSCGIPTSVLREVTMLKTLVHDNIVTLRRVLLPEEMRQSLPCVSLVFDYYSMTLYDYIFKEWNDQKEIPRTVVKKLFLQILDAVKFAHDHCIVHRDLKPSNIMITDSLQVKVGDFGLARYLGSPPYKSHTNEVATQYYRAPELFLGSTTYDISVDIWSLGCILAELLTKSILFYDNTSHAPSPIFTIVDLLGNPCEHGWADAMHLPHYQKYSFPNNTHVRLYDRYPQLTGSFQELVSMSLVYNPRKRASANALYDACVSTVIS